MIINTTDRDSMYLPRKISSTYAVILPESKLMKSVTINEHLMQGQSINYATQIVVRRIRKLLDT